MIPSEGVLRIEIESHGCHESKDVINYLEHVQLISTIDFTRRGDLQITLISPSGTKSNLLDKRSRDSSQAGFNDWPFMSTHFWGENPKGTWIVEIRNVGSSTERGAVHEIMLAMYGTDTMPDVMRRVLSKSNIQINNGDHHSSSEGNQIIGEENHVEQIQIGSNENQGQYHGNMHEHILDKQEGNKRWRLKSVHSNSLDHSYHKKYLGHTGIPKNLMRYYFQLLNRKDRNHYTSRSRLSRYQRDF